MEIGWIDFSRTERNKVLNVLSLLTEPGILDEFGIGSIRDAFSELFFPGTSTIQTRAKYFFIVPYALKDLEYINNSNPKDLLKEFNEKERECGQRLYEKNPNENGIIGSTKIPHNLWVQRPPSNIYLGGLKKFKILNHNLSIRRYISIIYSQNDDKINIRSLGNTNDKKELITDDNDAGINQSSRLLNIPTYHRDWFEKLEMDLTYDEGQFLKNQIISNFDDSMFAYILENNMCEVLEYKSFRELKPIIYKFPEQIQKDYIDAVDFSEFVFTLSVIYNLMVSNYENKNALKLFETIEKDLENISNINIDHIISRLNISRNPKLNQFLNQSKDCMKNNDIEGLKDKIKSREKFLKGNNRARLSTPGEEDVNKWFAGQYLDYRFGNVKIILNDIFKSIVVI